MGILKLYNRTIRLALPAITENVFTSVCFLADALMVAALKDEAALAAVGISGVVLWRLRSMAACLQVSVGATVARRWGEGNVTAARTVFTHGTFIGFLIGCLVLPLLPLTRAIFSAMHAEPSVLAYVIPYFQPILLVFPFRIASVSMTAAIRAAGDTRTPMISTIVMNLANILGNYILIFGHFGSPKLGVFGAGLATAISMVIEFAILFVVAYIGVRPKRLFALAAVEAIAPGGEEVDAAGPVYTPSSAEGGALKFSREGWRWWIPGLTGKLFRIAHPTFWEEIAISVGFIGFISMIAGLGEKALAAHTSVTRIESFSFNAGFGVSIAASTLVGQALGAGSLHEARRAFAACLTLSVVLMGGAGILFALAPGWFLHWFAPSQSDSFLPLAIPLLLLTAAEQPFIGTTNVLAGGLRGAGQTAAPFLAQMLGVVGVRIGIGYYLAFPMGLGMEGIYLATVFDWMMRTTVLGIIVLRGNWERAVV